MKISIVIVSKDDPLLADTLRALRSSVDQLSP